MFVGLEFMFNVLEFIFYDPELMFSVNELSIHSAKVQINPQNK